MRPGKIGPSPKDTSAPTAAGALALVENLKFSYG
jgi:hypothetical protein